MTEAFYRHAWKDGLAHNEAEEAAQNAVLHMLERIQHWPSVSRGENRKAFYTVRKYFRKSAWKGFSGLRRNNLQTKRSQAEHERRDTWRTHIEKISTAPAAIENTREALDKYTQRLKDLINKFNTQEREVILKQEASKQGPRRNRITRSAAAVLRNERARIQQKRSIVEKQLIQYHRLIILHGTRDELAKAFYGLQLATVETPTPQEARSLEQEARAENQRRHREHTEAINTETA